MKLLSLNTLINVSGISRFLPPVIDTQTFTGHSQPVLGHRGATVRNNS